jgi:hypothetical protein
LQCQEVKIVGRLAVDAQVVDLALRHKPWPKDGLVDGCTAVVPLLKHVSNIFGSQDSSDCIVTGNWLDSFSLITRKARAFSVLYSV